MESAQELSLVIELARGAARIALEQYGKVRRLTKRNAEAVTDADRACQKHIVEGLRRFFPGDGIIGEENDTGDAITFDCPDPDGRVWVIDPIDGTNNFVGGFGYFAVCIGRMEKGVPVLGVVLDVTRGQVYAAARGAGASLDGQPIRALDTPLSDSTLLMLTSNLLNSKGVPPQWAIRMIGQTVWKIRMGGSAALDAMQVAAGVAHGSITTNGKLWDIAAPAAVLLEAGVNLTDLQGQPIFPYKVSGYTGAKVPFLAAAPKAHEDLLREMRWHP
ncbi:MAG: inositol monophosphatase [Planctomycetes bacterium]|nr:inositol monophosphatase [Planctomycetota bacterium]